MGLAITATDFWESYKYDQKIDLIIDYHFIGPGKGEYMTGETEGQLLARYLYAVERINELLEEGKVTHISSSTRVENRDYFDPKELEILKIELLQIE